MNQEYAEYLADKARNGDKQAWHQLKRAGIEIEVDDLKEIDVNLFAYQGEKSGRIVEEIKPVSRKQTGRLRPPPALGSEVVRV